MYSHLVTAYIQINGETVAKVIAKNSVPQFIEEHKEMPFIEICDPRERTSTLYKYGKQIQRGTA